MKWTDSHPLPASLIIDDGAPVDIGHFIHPERPTPLIIPNSFTQAFADLCAEFGVRGKFSVIPMPCALGRLDEKLSYVPRPHVQQFIRIVRSHIAPRFDITPELLTHMAAYDLAARRFLHLYEDEWVAQADGSQIEDYLVLALQILKKIGLNANGVTSPWATGCRNESVYAQAIGQAMYRVHRRKFSWYFLHTLRPRTARWPWLAFQSSNGLRVMTVSSHTPDVYGLAMHARSLRAARRAAEDSADAMLSRDGTRGHLRELVNRKMPVILLTHWQNLFCAGRAAGLRALETTFRRMHDVLGDKLQWITCSDLARRSMEQLEQKQELQSIG